MSKTNSASDQSGLKPRGRTGSIFKENWGDNISRQSTRLRTKDFVFENVDATPDPNSLFYFKTLMFASVLEDTITEIRILSECNNELRILKAQTDMGLLLAHKYSVVQPKVLDELAGIDAKTVHKEEYKLEKLATDRKYLFKTLLDTYSDLSLSRNYKSLLDRIAVVVERENQHAFLLEDEAKNKNTRRELAKQLRLQRNHVKSVNYDTDLSIENLKTQVEDAVLTTEIQSRYIHNWQVARTEQHHQAIKDKESRPLENIELYKMKTDHEQRVHTEVELLINIAINEKLEQVESWMDKYDKDIEKMDLKIQIKKNDLTNQLEKRIQLEDTFAKHEKLMKDWIHFKDEREKARLYREKMTNAATVVQSWWRGLLVRMQLGPYKPVKKPRGAKKKK